jgi:DNA (cytosine-5)-methyltransferase 1
MRPKMLDLYCCEGGSWRGWTDAGFDTLGIDTFEEYSQKRYPGASFKGDAILALVRLLAGECLPFTHPDGTVEWLGRADFIAASSSPPCQHASAGTRSIRKTEASKYPALINPTRWLLQQTGLPYVIENVRGADLINPVELCGCMFDLKAVDTDGITLHLQRPRRFESNFPITPPRDHDHADHLWVGGSYGGARRDKYEAKYIRKGGYVPSIPVQRELLGIDWMTQKGMYQSLPPAYTHHIGLQLMAYLQDQQAVAA